MVDGLIVGGLIVALALLAVYLLDEIKRLP
jgi:hypothetical protein